MQTRIKEGFLISEKEGEEKVLTIDELLQVMFYYILDSICSCWHADTEKDGNATQGEVGGEICRTMTTTYSYVSHRLGRLAGFFL